MPERSGSAVVADLRMAVPAIVAWCAAAAAVAVPPTVAIVVCLAAVVVAVVAARRAAPLLAILAVLVAGIALAAGVRVGAVHSGAVARLGEQHATAVAQLRVDSDPRVVTTPHRTLVVFDATIREVTARGRHARVHSPVVVWAPESAKDVELGTTLECAGQLSPSDDSARAASFETHRLKRIGGRAWWWSASDRMRGAVTESVSHEGEDVRALVPALVHGDDHALSDDLKEDFKDSGLTHLLAVSGTNLTLVVGFLLTITRPFGVSGRARIAVGIVGTIAFVVLARPEPSVVRAAVMGLVALIGLGSGGRGRGVRCLGWAVVVLVLVDPWLARSAGFMLSTLATAGILVLAPPWRDAMARWMPRWCAEVLAVPMAAQLACTPVIAAISGKVSMVAVVANVLAGPAVGPATVLGLLGGAVDLVWPAAGRGVGFLAGLFARWIIGVGRHGAALPGAAYAWGSGPVAVVALTVLCVALAFCAGPLLRRPVPGCAFALLSVVVVIRPVTIGWPPHDWVMIACDVGQGDATLLNAGDGEVVVVDTGPDPRAADRCLRRVGARRIPLVVLTHGHADHVDGLPGVVQGRQVGEIESGPGGAPTLPAGVRHRDVSYGETRRVGDLSWTVVAPESMAPVALDASDGEGSAANDASIVMLVSVRGFSLLLTGDIEPLAQEALRRSHPLLHADVIKVPHHGSARQDAAWFGTLGARYGTLSAGVHNTFGHPAPKTIAMMRGLGITPLRTDTQGDLAIVVRAGKLSAMTQ